MFQRTDIAFEAEGGVTLRGWLYVPTGGTGPYPAITMAHGYAGVKEHGLERFAEKFASNGFVVLLHDHRNFGASDGTPRQDIDPWRQIADWRRAISFLEHRDVVNAERIGLWGTSYSGGHALVLGATERRLRAVVAQVPTISGFEQGLRRIPPDTVAAIAGGLLGARWGASAIPPQWRSRVNGWPGLRADDLVSLAHAAACRGSGSRPTTSP